MKGKWQRYPFRLAASRQSTFPKGTASAVKESLRQCQRRPLGGAGTAQAVTEGVHAKTPPVAYGDRFPFLSLRDIFPRPGEVVL